MLASLRLVLPHNSRAKFCAWSVDSDHVAVGVDKSIIVWQNDRRRHKVSLSQRPHCCALSSRLLMVATESHVHVFGLSESDSPRLLFLIDMEFVSCCALSADSSALAMYAKSAHTMGVWRDGRLLTWTEEISLTAMVFVGNHVLQTAAARSAVVRRRDLQTGVVEKLSLPMPYDMLAAAVSPNFRATIDSWLYRHIFITPFDGSPQFRQLLDDLTARHGHLHALKLSPGDPIVAAVFDNTVNMVDPGFSQVLRFAEPVSDCQFDAADGSRLLVATGTAVHIYSVRSSARLFMLAAACLLLPPELIFWTCL